LKTYFYYLVDPDTKEIRYIGQSKNPKQRLSAHISAAKNDKEKNSRKKNWIKSLLAQNKKPELCIFETFYGSPENSHKREWELIQQHFDNGVRLTNGNDGGAPYLLPDDRVRKVYKYNRTTLVFIKEYRCAFDASIETGIHDSSIGISARSIQRHRVKFAGNFLWSYDKYEIFPKELLLFSTRHNKKKVKATHLQTNITTIYDSARDAAHILGLSYRNISQVCKGQKHTHKGYTFCFL
jgi:hypothetical protein